MDKQEVFNTVAKHLFAQGKRSMKSDSVGLEYCVYRAPDGCMCAVGAILPDELYNPTMDEGYGLSRLMESFHEVRDFFGFENKSFLTALQVAHDDPMHWKSTGIMKEVLRDVALNYSLDYSILDTLSFANR